MIWFLTFIPPCSPFFFTHRVDMEMMMNKLIPEVCLLLHVIIIIVYCWFIIIKNLLEWNRSFLICLSDHHQQSVRFSISPLYPWAILIGYHCNLTANSKYTCICTFIFMYVYHPFTIWLCTKIKWIMFYKQNVLSNIKGFLYNVHKVQFDWRS